VVTLARKKQTENQEVRSKNQDPGVETKEKKVSQSSKQKISEKRGTESKKLLLAHKEQIEQLKKRLSAKEAEAAEYLETLKRVRAELENFRKRMLKEQTQFLEFASQNLILQLLPVIDNLERAVEAAQSGNNNEKLTEGVEMVLAQIKDILSKEGLNPIDPQGEIFDPIKHEAVLRVESDEEENTIVEVLQKGYSFKGRVLRPAMVKVAIPKSKEEEKTE
jgi:molecular chaperone GrpE